MDFDATKIKHILELAEGSNAEKYLQAGWILLSNPVGGTAFVQNGDRDAYYLYTLGWDKEDEPVRPVID